MLALKQWYCDVCGKIIEAPEYGYVVWKWLDDTVDVAIKGHFKYRIIHKNNVNAQGVKCGCDNDSSFTHSLELDDFLGFDGLVQLLSIIDPGPMHMPEYSEQITNMRDYLEFFRRVQLPYYEEARTLWHLAQEDGFFAGANEIWIYSPSTLKELVKKYGNNRNL